MKLSIFALAALAPLALAKDFTLYFSTHNRDYTLNTSGGNSVEGVKLSDDKGALKVLGSYTFTAPGTTMIALSISQSSVCWCDVTLNKAPKVDSANLVLANGSPMPKVVSTLRPVVKNTKIEAGLVTLDCRCN